MLCRELWLDYESVRISTVCRVLSVCLEVAVGFELSRIRLEKWSDLSWIKVCTGNHGFEDIFMEIEFFRNIAISLKMLGIIFEDTIRK